MITFEKQLEAVIRENVQSYNNDLDKEFEEEIIRKTIASKMKELVIVDSRKIIGVKPNKKHEYDVSKVEPNGVWIYREPTVKEWVFERYDTIEQAIKVAINYIEDVKIICDGEIVEWGIVDNYMAIYLDNQEVERFVRVKIA